MGILTWIWGLATRRPSAKELHEERVRKGRARAEREGLLYDAYPDEQRHPRVTIWLRGKVGGRSIIEQVDLDGYSFRELNLRRGQWRRNWLVDRLLEAHLRILPRLDVMEQERQRRIAERKK